MDSINIVLSIIILINLVLVVISSSGNRNKGDKGIQYSVYLLKMTTIVWWAGSLIFYRLANWENIDFISKNLYVAATLIGSSFYYFSLIFPDPEHGYIKDLFKVIVVNSTLIYLILFTPLVITGGEVSSTGENSLLFGPYYFLFVVYTLYYMGRGFYKFFIKYKKTTISARKSQLLYLFLGYTISSIVAYVTNLILPALHNYEYMWIGPTATIVMLFAITSAVTRHHLFNIKIIATEIFIFVLWVFTLLKISVFEQFEKNGVPITYNRAFTHVAFLTVSIIVGILLIKSVKKQAEQHEENLCLFNELADANRKLKEVDEIKSKFVSLARHQMASPLTAINAYSSLLNDKDIDLDKIGLKSLQGIIDRFVIIIRDFLSISQIENEEVKYSKDDFDVSQIINDILCEKQFSINHQNITVDFNFKIGENYIVRGDKEKFKNALENIIENSIFYSKDLKIDIYLSKIKEGEVQKIKIIINDEGIRSLPNISPVLLNKFSKDGDAMEGALSASSLGLYVSRLYIEAQGGSLKIKVGNDGKRCKFIVILS